MTIYQARAIELFSGAGGLALGLAMAGFQHELLVDLNHHAVNTLQLNHDREHQAIKNWNIVKADVNDIAFKNYHNTIALIAGGPPCQPFSLGGKHKGINDNRDMFPQAVRAVRDIEPAAFIFENVKGLLRKNFRPYFEYILLQLTYPTILIASNESWQQHLARLEEIRAKDTHIGLKYDVAFQLFNAADYGVPQKRERVFIVGFRSDLGINWDFPPATHSQEALHWQQWVTNEYWDRLNIPLSERPQRTPDIDALARKLDRKYGLFEPSEKPWGTVREAIIDLPCPMASNSVANHEFKDGAKSYPGHTGSAIDQPSKTLKAGDHGVPGGENMIRFNDDTIRYFTIREAARMQTFPDDYVFTGSWSECMRQLGNAVPVTLAHVIGTSVYQRLFFHNFDHMLLNIHTTLSHVNVDQ